MNRYLMSWLTCAGTLAVTLAVTTQAEGTGAIDLAANGTATQSSTAESATTADKAIDGNVDTFSATASIPDSYWQVTLNNRYTVDRVELVNRVSSRFHAMMGGLKVRLYDMAGQCVASADVTDPGSGATWSVDLPDGVVARSARVALEGGQLNDGGTYQVIVAEVRLYGEPVSPAGPIDLNTHATVYQSSTYGGYSAALAIDGDPTTFTHTENLADGYWFATLDAPRPIEHVEIANRHDAGAARLAGLTLRIYDDASNSVASATLNNPGLGGTWAYTPPPGTTGRYVRIGLEGGAKNGENNYYVSLGEVNLFSSANVAQGNDSYMVRYQDSLPPASVANDGNYATEAKSTSASVDCYWEVDLGEPHALQVVRTVAANGFAQRMSHATLRLFDDNHDSVYSRHLSGLNPTFDVATAGSPPARFVRVGFENKERSSPNNSIEWYLGLKEVQAFGRPAAELGILEFAVSTNRVATGEPVTLSWQVEGLDALLLYPGAEPVGAFTDGAGHGSLTLYPSNSVEYMLLGTYPGVTTTRAASVIVDGAPLPPRLSEFVADNRLSLRDGHGEAPDWIELYNPNDDPLDLEGYGLSDRTDRPMKWTFPTTNMPAHGYLVVCASGRSTPVDDEGRLHADFKLDADSESVVLTAPDGVTLLDAVTNYPPQMEDLAYGRTLDGNWTFIEPTPLALNHADTYAGWLSPPQFNYKRGFYTNAFLLTVTQDNPGAELFYSTDGTEPSIPWAGALPISGSTCVRAAVAREGYKAPRVKTHTYLFLDAVLTSPVMNQSTVQSYYTRARAGLREVPTFSVVVPDVPNAGTTNDYVEREASVELLWPDGSHGAVQANCGFFRFGGAWTTFAKKNYRLKFRTEYGDRKLEAPLFNGFDHGVRVAEVFDQLDLRGGGHDMEQRGFYMSNRFVEDTMLDMGSLNPHGRFVNLYINGTYWGQYNCRERLVDRFLADYCGGPAEDYLSVRGNDNVGSSFIPGTPDPPNRAPWNYVLDNRGDYEALKDSVDMPNLIDFMLLWFYGNCETEYRSAGSIARARVGFKFWVADTDGFLRVYTDNSTGNAGPANLFGTLRTEAHPDFKTLVADRIYKHFFNNGAMTPAQNEARLNRRMDEIYNNMVNECARWGVRTPANWESAAQNIRDNMFPTRTTQLFGYLRGRGLYPAFDPPAFNQHGGSVSNGFEVTLDSTAGTIYYTLDGSDPRLPGGAVSPTARVYGTAGAATNTLLPAGAVWRYWDRNSLPAANWNTTAYDDSAWSSGPAELGYGDTQATAVDYSDNETCYFRTTFTLDGTEGIDALLFELLRDDGAVVYLNGQEVFRDNMPEGTVAYDTWAVDRVSTDESTFFPHRMAPDALVAGNNLLAVEVHQVADPSTDISFNLALSALETTSGTITITSNTVVKTRVWTGTEWSALSEATFLMADRRPVAAGDVAITEIHFNPVDSDAYEFVEIQNVSTSLVDFTGATLSDGVDFWFPAGFCLAPNAVAVVVEDLAAFSNRYSNPSSPYYYADIDVVGEWSGALADEGERVALSASNGTEAVAVTYETGGDWPERDDGKGSSLELANPAAMPADAVARAAYLANGLHWRSSSLYHGSPGRIDPFAHPVVINEVLAHTDAETDWVELYNRSTAPVDLSGLGLGDHYDRPARYTIPGGTVLAPGAFLTYDTADLGFGFSELGSDILLVEMSGTNVLRFYDTVDIPAMEREETIGRYRRSDALFDFTELRAGTRGTTNALPRVGPVVFSEIMYRPATGATEYVELCNITANAVPFFDPLRPTNTWKLSGAVTYTFPTNVTLAPGALCLVCATNPAAFRAEYGVSDTIPVYGPWDGALNNAGESVKLWYPGDPEPDGFVPYYRTDRVNYRPDAPWPAEADTAAISLERLPLEAYGNDPAAWVASAPGGSPGTVNGNRPPMLLVIGTNRVDEGGAFALTAAADDPDAPWQSVSLSADALPAGAAFNAENGSFSWVTGEADGPGEYSVHFMARDTACHAAVTTQAVTLTVHELNQPPAFNAVADQRYPAETPFRLALSAIDGDLPAQSLTFAQTGLPEGLVLDPQTGTIAGRACATGAHVVVVIVSDNWTPALTATNTFLLDVSEPFRLDCAFKHSGGELQLAFPTLTGETYQVQYSESLNPCDWHVLRTVADATGTVLRVDDSDAPAHPQRYYRIQWLR